MKSHISKCITLVFCVMSVIWSLSFGMDDIVTSSDGRIRGVRNTHGRDFILGGLFAVHRFDQESGVPCGEIRCGGGTDRVEAMMLAIDEINRDPVLLPNLTLGYDIRDSCNEERIGLDEAAALILSRTNFAPNDNFDQCSVNNSARAGGSTQGRVIGLVGAGSSRLSVLIASLTRLFETPQISYSSTSAILSNRQLYPYFFRTIPSDVKVAAAIIDMLRHFKWTLISTVFTRDSYGQSGIDDLHDLAEEYGICVDLSEGIEADFTDGDFEMLAERISSNSKANVIILYAHREAAQSLLSKMAESHFTWIATNALLDSTNATSTVTGLFEVIASFSAVERFTEHFNRTLTEMDSTRNPWISEFLQCSESYNQDYAIPRVIDAVYTFAHALNNYLKENCAQPITWIPENQTCVGVKQLLTGSLLLKYIENTSFIGSANTTVNFDSEGSVQSLYDIINYQLPMDGVSDEVNVTKVGIWNSTCNRYNNNSRECLQIRNDLQIHFGLDEFGDVIVQPTKSQCGRCKPGEYLRVVLTSCCGLCEPCLGQNFSNSSSATECFNCSSLGDFWGNNPTIGSSSCVPIPQIFLKLSDPWSIVVMSSSAIGLVLLFCVVIIFAVNWNTPVIRASGRESMIMMVIGTTISFLVAFVHVAPPSLPVCTLQRVSLWLGFGLVFSALTAKVVRIARIFVFQTSSYVHIKCINSHHIFIQTVLLFTVEVIIVLISFSTRLPQVVKTLRLNPTDHHKLPEIVVTCLPDHEVGLVVSLVYETGLVVTSAVLATMSFKSPANFNESKSICCATFGLLLVWAVYFLTYFALQTRQEIQNATIAGTVTITAYVLLFCLFGPRVFLVIFCKKNRMTGRSGQHVSVGKGATSLTLHEKSSSNTLTTNGGNQRLSDNNILTN